ncbi:rCG35036 [Rattus norvegicus]|uniref:RCG35036 n=1 Tax=Rattus norvegicus TaxID=10116 RepID=A6HE67_RAT|nr:rCG35036 [Rattus norvegicus]
MCLLPEPKSALFIAFIAPSLLSKPFVGLFGSFFFFFFNEGVFNHSSFAYHITHCTTRKTIRKWC